MFIYQEQPFISHEAFMYNSCLEGESTWLLIRAQIAISILLSSEVLEMFKFKISSGTDVGFVLLLKILFQ